jgi:hypothetical protein
MVDEQPAAVMIERGKHLQLSGNVPKQVAGRHDRKSRTASARVSV